MPDQWKSCGGIWERKTKKGDDMLSLMIGEVPYIAFRNKRKEPGTKNPDWQVFESKPLDKPKEPEQPKDDVPF
jgi:hypothetical protein